MAITSTTESNNVSLKLNSGTTSQGTAIVKTLNITGLKSTAFTNEDKQKIYNIVNAIMPLMSYSLISTVFTSRETLEEE